MASLCILKGFRELPNPGVGSRAVAEEKVVVAVQCDGLCVAVNGLEEIALLTNRVHAGGMRLRDEVKSSVCESVTCVCVSMCAGVLVCVKMPDVCKLTPINICNVLATK